jgi:hypothetical protein
VARLGTHDNLMERITAADPASDVAPLPEAALSRIVRHAMTPAPRIWSRGRFRFASIGALLGSGGLVLAGILGLEAAAPTLPLLTLGKIPQESVALQPQGYGATTASPSARSASFSFESVPTHGLAVTPRTATAYRLVSPLAAATAATSLAVVLHVRGPVVSLQPTSYRVGTSPGPTVTTWTFGGVVEWSYSAVATATNGVSGEVHAPLPTVKHADSEAQSLLSRLAVPAVVGAPKGSRTRYAVDVGVPIVVGRSATDQVDEVTFGPASTLESASGLLAKLIAGPAYPTISVSQAIAVLRADHGFVFYGGIAPNLGGVSSLPNTYQTNLGTHSGTATGPPPVVRVEIDRATLQYATYVLANGTSWLLPTWSLSGTEHGAGIRAGARYSAYVLAIAPRYVRLESGSAAP